MTTFRKIFTWVREDRTVATCLAVGLFFHLWAAVFSLGFFHWDEHFQILEFMGYKLGVTPVRDLPWEFRERIRPWFQPGTLTLVTRGLITLGIRNPFHWAIAARLISATLGYLSLIGMLGCARAWVRPTTWRFCAIFSGLFWAFPYLHARASSESWSGSFFFLAFFLLVSPREDDRIAPGRSLLAGALLGAAFESRFQIGFAIAGLLVWLAYTQSPRFPARLRSRWLPLLTGLFLMLLAGFLIDGWGYGTPTNAPYRYLYENLVENRAAQWGVSPWWNYARMLTLTASPPLGVIALLALFVMWLRRPRHPLTWVTVPFVIVHSAIAHKELRFLFPLLDTVPAMLGLAWESLARGAEPGLSLRRAIKMLLALNLVPLVVYASIPTRTEVGFFQELYAHRVKALYTTGVNPFHAAALPFWFYRPRGFQVARITSFASFRMDLINAGKPLWLFDDESELPAGAGQLRTLCHEEISTLPRWLRRPEILRYVHTTPWQVYRCFPPEKTSGS